MNWYLEAMKKYAQFSGRSRRMEYWMFYLFNVVFMIVLGIIDGMTGTFSPEAGLGALTGLYLLVVFIPSFAVTVRRLHDTSRSGWWLLIGFIPLIGGIVLFVFTCMDSHQDNQYGQSPKAAPA